MLPISVYYSRAREINISPTCCVSQGQEQHLIVVEKDYIPAG